MRPLAILAGLVALAFSQGAHAKSLADELCAEAGPDRRITRTALRDAVLDRAGLSFAALNANGDDDVSSSEWFAALTTPADVFCAVGTAGRTTPCGDATMLALTNADAALAGFWEQRGVAFDVVGADGGISGEHPWRVVLDPRGTATVVCRSATPQRAPRRLPPFLLGSDIASLTVDRGAPDDEDRLAKVEPAAITLVSDRAARTRTVSIDAVAGVSVVDRSDLKLIPFLQYSREETKDRGAGTDEVTGKFAIGAVASVRFGSDVFDLAPLYARNLENHAELLGGRLTWRPGFLYRFKPFMSASHFACGPKRNGACPLGKGLAAWADLRLVTAFGTVLDDGSDPTFVEGREYLRAGPAANLHVYGLSGAVRDFSLDVGYSRLFGLAGDGRDVTAFKTDLRWWIAGSQHVALTYGYERSRDEETLALTDQWKLGLGVRF